MKDTILNEKVASTNMFDSFLKHQAAHDIQEEIVKLDEQKNAAQDAFMAHDTPVQGRLSPEVKERIYREYLTGTTVKDLSLAYGILPQRVKAIVY